PFFPFKASTYAFGLTTMRLRDFALGTALGIVPLTVVNVAIGALAGDVASVIASDRERAAWEWAVYAAGLIPLCILVVVIGRRAERRLAAQRADAVR
ncbi:MAG: TVP38/TMEM64 family protein, partial [Gammaproteobacteria bacterium]